LPTFELYVILIHIVKNYQGFIEGQRMEGNLWPDELKILVIDDDQEVLNLIRLSLEQAGFRVLRTTRPEEGLHLALTEEPDLLLLDVMMPGLDGFELLHRVRRHAKLEEVPVVIISARATTLAQQRMLRISQAHNDEIDAYIGKPFDPAGLLRTVKNVLMEHRDFLLQKNKPQKRPWEEISDRPFAEDS
jgi:DNA-binding response OmpR family regulator